MSKPKFNKTEYTGIFWYETKTKGKLYAIRARYKDQYDTWQEKPEQGFKKIKEARTRKRELEELLEQNPASLEGDKITFGEWGKKYFELNSPTWAIDSIIGFNSAFYSHLIALHDISLSKLSKLQYQNHINYLLYDKNYAVSTVRRDHAIMMAIINSAVNHDVLAKNKLRDTKIHKLSTPKKKFLEMDELKKIDDVAPTLNVTEYACYTLMRIGWRRSEVTGLVLGSVRIIDNDTIDVSVLETRGTKKERTTPKSMSSYRTNRLKGGYAKAILKAIEFSKQIHIDNNIKFGDESRILVNKKGITRHRNFPGEVCNKLVEKTGIHVHPHMLRHTLITHARENNVNIVNVQEWVGHSDPRTTLLYTHATNDGRSRLVDLANS